MEDMYTAQIVRQLLEIIQYRIRGHASIGVIRSPRRRAQASLSPPIVNYGPYHEFLCPSGDTTCQDDGIVQRPVESPSLIIHRFPVFSPRSASARTYKLRE